MTTMENSQQIEDKSIERGEASAEVSGQHRPQDDVRKENEDDFEDPSSAQSNEHGKEATSPITSPGSGKIDISKGMAIATKIQW